MHIGILQCGQSPEGLREAAGDYPDMFVRLLAGRGLTFTTWHVEAMAFPPGPQAAEGWLITGSRHGVYEPHPFIPPLETFIRDAHAAGIPLVGICFGHQIIAQALGGRVEKFSGGWAVGAQDYDFDGETLTLNAWHQDQVVAVPPGARVAATGPTCAAAALVYGDTAYSVQAHPEFDDAFTAGLIAERAPGVVPDRLLDAARARMGGRVDGAVIADRIAGFLHAAADRRARGAA